MNASKMRLWNRIHAVEPATRQIAFRTIGLASKHLGIELNQSFPVPGDQICMNVLSANWHCFVLSKSSRTTIGLHDTATGERKRCEDASHSNSEGLREAALGAKCTQEASFLFAKLWACALPARRRAGVLASLFLQQTL
jgi:hypothetical protein